MTAPLIQSLAPAQSEEILKRNRVGRIAFTTQGRVNILPMHYRYDSGWIYGRTQPGGKLLLILRNRRVAFEVDEHKDVFDWRSVVAHGTFYIVDPLDRKVYERAVEMMRQVMPGTMTADDPTPFRTHFFRINVAEVTGRSASPTGGQIADVSKEEPTESAVAEQDIKLREAVRGAISRVKSVDVSRVTVEVMEGILMLGGVVDNHVEVSDIERAATGVPGARVIVFQIEVDSPGEASPDPVDLALAVNETLSRAANISSDDVRVIIENGWLRTEGTVKSASEHADIVRELRRVRGARGLVDRIRVG